MTEIEKRQAALTLLASSGLHGSDFRPPALRLLWRMGVNARPPHFRSFLYNTLSNGVSFAVIFGLFMWLGVWRHEGEPLRGLIVAAAGGLVNGMLMASYYAYGRRKHKLPAWEELEAGCIKKPQV